MNILARYRKSLFVAIACAGIIVLAVRLLNTHDVTLRNVDGQALLLYGSLAIALQLGGHWLRAVKHRYLLEQIRPIQTREVFKGQMIGLLFNTILPFRLGELVRAHYIGKGVSISRSAVFATILFERLLDTIVLGGIGIILLLNASGSYSQSLLTTVIIIGLGMVLLGGLLWAARNQHSWLLRSVWQASSIFNTTIRDRIRMVCWSAIYCLKNVVTRQRLPDYAGLTASMWGLYISSAAIVIYGLIPSITPFKQFLAAVAVYFGVSVPSGPAYIGTFREIFSDISTIPDTLLTNTHLPFVLWLLLILPTTTIGLLLLFTKQHIYQPQQDVMNVLRNKLYRDTDITREFSHFLDAYFKGDRLNRILTSQELANNFQVLKTFKGGSNALTLLAWQDEHMVVKKITLKQYQGKLQAQHQWLSHYAQHPQIARVVQEHTGHADFYAIDIEYHQDFIPFFDFIHSSSAAQSKKILRDVCEFVDETIYQPAKPAKRPANTLKKYIDTKVIGKVTDAANANLPIAHLLAYDTLVVNGREIQNFDTILSRLTTHKQAMADLADVIDCPIQGDLTIDNIIVNPATKEFVILDPNNENAISDPIVDYAKLMQSIHSGYEFLYGLPVCTVSGNHISFEERRSVQYNGLHRELRSYLQDRLTPGRFRALLFHEAVHYYRMLTYRVDINPDTAAAFYCVAVRLLNDFMEQYDEAKTT